MAPLSLHGGSERATPDGGWTPGLRFSEPLPSLEQPRPGGCRRTSKWSSGTTSKGRKVLEGEAVNSRPSKVRWAGGDYPIQRRGPAWVTSRNGARRGCVFLLRTHNSEIFT